MEKHYQYAAILNGKIAEAIEQIGNEEVGANLTDFFHALANITPTLIYNEAIGDGEPLNYLEFNHLANKLCFQYMGSKTNP